LIFYVILTTCKPLNHKNGIKEKSNAYEFWCTYFYFASPFISLQATPQNKTKQNKKHLLKPLKNIEEYICFFLRIMKFLNFWETTCFKVWSTLLQSKELRVQLHDPHNLNNKNVLVYNPFLSSWTLV
jgi:hypothetical protein